MGREPAADCRLGLGGVTGAGEVPAGRFVVLEGGEACGKSTQAGLLAQRLGAWLTREPGGTPVGERIRSLVLDPDGGTIDPRTETLLLLAARAQHVSQVVAPALAAGRDVVCDRFVGSTLAYQGHGRGLDVGELRRLSAWAAGGLQPDLVVLLAVPPEEVLRRQAARGVPDRLEAAGDPFHRRVHDGFSALAAADPGRWCVVDGTGSVAEVAQRVLAAVESSPAFSRRTG